MDNIKQRSDLTFKDNLKRGRHGWVRLTPAYSVKIVHQILEEFPNASHILDPFSGTGTTGLVAAQQGFHAVLVDVNPFLVWLASAKTATYSPQQLEQTQRWTDAVIQYAPQVASDSLWVPPISHIERWWSDAELDTVARLFAAIETVTDDGPSRDLMLVAFCQVLIKWSNASFNHQSVSFKSSADSVQLSLFDHGTRHHRWQEFAEHVAHLVGHLGQNPRGRVDVFQGDARNLLNALSPEHKVDLVITSPPYPNRMSYIRELRPYMFWLGYLSTGREAGELDWQAIGGTWGIATSRLSAWEPDAKLPMLAASVDQIRRTSPILANYIARYFEDMEQHINNLVPILLPGSSIHYIIGNAKFYDTMIHAEQLLAHLLQRAGFSDVSIQVVRKRNSKKELFEYRVSARWH